MSGFVKGALAVTAAFLACLGIVSATALSSGGATPVAAIKLLSFQAEYDGNVTTHYTAVFTTFNNEAPTVTWLFTFSNAPCGTFVGGQEIGGSKSDLSKHANAQPGPKAGEFQATAAYAHPGCPPNLETTPRLALDLSDGYCTISYTQHAREDDEPSVIEQNPPVSEHGNSCMTTAGQGTTESITTQTTGGTRPTIEKFTKYTPEQKAHFKFLKHVYAFGAVATGVIAAALFEVPPLALGVGCLAASEGASAEVYDIAADDPVDPHYKTLAVPARAVAKALPGGIDLRSAESAALKALLANSAQLKADITAMITAINRAQGAAKAHDADWVKKQQHAAAKYASASAALIAAQPKLQAALLGALQGAGLRSSLSADQIAKAVASVKKNGFPVPVLLAFQSLRLSAAQVQSLRDQVSTVSGAQSLTSSTAKVNAQVGTAVSTLHAFAKAYG